MRRYVLEASLEAPRGLFLCIVLKAPPSGETSLIRRQPIAVNNYYYNKNPKPNLSSVSMWCLRATINTARCPVRVRSFSLGLLVRTFEQYD